MARFISRMRIYYIAASGIRQNQLITHISQFSVSAQNRCKQIVLVIRNKSSQTPNST